MRTVKLTKLGLVSQQAACLQCKYEAYLPIILLQFELANSFLTWSHSSRIFFADLALCVADLVHLEKFLVKLCVFHTSVNKHSMTILNASLQKSVLLHITTACLFFDQTAHCTSLTLLLPSNNTQD